jgi:hypothetical protein
VYCCSSAASHIPSFYGTIATLKSVSLFGNFRVADPIQLPKLRMYEQPQLASKHGHAALCTNPSQPRVAVSNNVPAQLTSGHRLARVLSAGK